MKQVKWVKAVMVDWNRGRILRLNKWSRKEYVDESNENVCTYANIFDHIFGRHKAIWDLGVWINHTVDWSLSTAANISHKGFLFILFLFLTVHLNTFKKLLKYLFIFMRDKELLIYFSLKSALWWKSTF